MDRKRIIFILIIIIMVGGGLIWYFYQQTANQALIASGTMEGTEVTVSSKVTGKVLEVRVDEGSKVHSGEVLAVLDAQELGEALKSAQARYKIAKDDFERSQQLYRDKMISPLRAVTRPFSRRDVMRSPCLLAWLVLRRSGNEQPPNSHGEQGDFSTKHL